MLDDTGINYKEQYNPDALFKQYDIIHAQDVIPTSKQISDKKRRGFSHRKIRQRIFII